MGRPPGLIIRLGTKCMLKSHRRGPENHMLRMKMQFQCFEEPTFLKRRPDSTGNPDFYSGAELEFESLATTLDVGH